MKKSTALFMAVAFIVLGLIGSAQARVSLDATAALRQVPAERSNKIGAGLDGLIPLAGGNVTWKAGVNYTGGNILQMNLPTGGDVTFTANSWIVEEGTAGTGAFAYTSVPSDNTVSWQVVVGNTFGVGTHRVTPPAGTNALDLSAMASAAKTVDLNAKMVSAGGIVLDPAGTDTILETVFQYANNNPGVKADIIDAIGAQAMLFVGSTVISNAHTFDIASTFAAGTAPITPEFGASDSLVLNFSGNNAFNNMQSIRFYEVTGAYTIVKDVTAATNAAAFTFSNVELAGLIGTNAGPGAQNMTFAIDMVALGTEEILARTVSATASLILNTTGNGQRDLGNYGDVFDFVQNGTLFRLARFSTSDSQVTNTKLTNTSNGDVAFDVRFYEEGSAPTDWARYDALIPADDSLTVTKDDIMRVLNITDTTLWGFVEFRVHTGLNNVTAQAFMRHSINNFAANVPIPYFDAAANQWSF